MSKLYAGAGKVTIDPPKEYYPFPTNFGMTDESRNPCHVRALALDNTEKKILFVVFEMSDIPSHPDLMKRLCEASGYKEEEIIVAVTHNHSAPNDRSKMVKGADDKFAFFKEYAVTQACTAVRQAVSSMRKAKIGYGEIQSYCNVNRDKKTAYGFWVEGPAYDLYSNHTLAVVKITDEQDRMIAAMLNFGAHAVCAFCAKDTDGKIKSSSNFPGIACEFVENYYGNDAVCIWTSGAAGNQDPLLFEYQYKEYEDGYVTRLDYPDGTGYLNMDILGTQQGADAVQCLESIVTAEEDEIALITSSVQIPTRMKDPSVWSAYGRTRREKAGRSAGDAGTAEDGAGSRQDAECGGAGDPSRPYRYSSDQRGDLRGDWQRYDESYRPGRCLRDHAYSRRRRLYAG